MCIGAFKEEKQCQCYLFFFFFFLSTHSTYSGNFLYSAVKKRRHCLGCGRSIFKHIPPQQAFKTLPGSWGIMNVAKDGRFVEETGKKDDRKKVPLTLRQQSLSPEIAINDLLNSYPLSAENRWMYTCSNLNFCSCTITIFSTCTYIPNHQTNAN